MKGSATNQVKRKMTIDMFEIDDVHGKSNGSGTSSHSEDARKPTNQAHQRLVVKTIEPQSFNSQTNGLESEASRSKTNGLSKVSKESKMEKKKLKKCRSVERSHVHLVYSQMAPHLHGIQQKAWPRVKQFLKSLQPGSIVADIGCGSGRYLHINKLVYKLGSDICIPLVQYAKEKGHEVMVADNLMLPYRHGVFDAVVSIGVVHHFSSYERRVQALKELTRVLSPGGRLLVCVWAFEQKHRRFDSQDVLIPWYKPPQSDLQRVRGSCSDFERSSTSSVSDDDASSISSSLSIDSLQETSSRSYNLQESSSKSYSLQQNNVENKSLVQECRRVEACLKKMSLKPEDYPADKLNLNSEVTTNGLEPTSSKYVGIRTNLKVVQTNQDGAMPFTTLSTEYSPWNQHLGCGDIRIASEGSGYSAGHTAAEGCSKQCSDFEKRKASCSALTQIPCFSPCRPSDIGLHCAHTSTQTVLKLDSEMFNSSRSRGDSKHSVKPGLLQKFKMAFSKLFSSHHHSRDPMDFLDNNQISDQPLSYGKFPQGFQVREFPQSSLGAGNQCHQKQQVKSKGYRSSSLTDGLSCTKMLEDKEFNEMYTNGFSHKGSMLLKGEHKTSHHHHEENFVLKEQTVRDLVDEDVFGDTSAVKNSVQAKHKQSFAHTSSDETLEMKVPFEPEEDIENLGHLEVSFTNSELSRYYHVFREGELKQLVSENIEDLVIVDTYFDHANWCLIAEKVSNI